MSTSKQANFDFSLDFALIAKKKVEDGKKQKSNNKTRIKENKHIYHKNLYDPVLRKLKSEKFRQKLREKKKAKLLKTKNNKNRTVVKANSESSGGLTKKIQNCEKKSESADSSCKLGEFSLQGQLKTVKNVFPKELLKDFPFLASSDSEDEILSLFKLFDSAIRNSNIT